MKSQRIRITEPGWASYTGSLHGIEFTNGLSNEMVPPSTMSLLGGIFRVEGADDARQVGASVVYQDAQTNEAPVVAELPRAEEGATDVLSTPVVPADVVIYTREELEKIADEKGIAGLREIAAVYKVKGRGIQEIITEVLAAQSNLLATAG